MKNTNEKRDLTSGTHGENLVYLLPHGGHDMFWGHMSSRNIPRTLAGWEVQVRGWPGREGSWGVPELDSVITYPGVGLK